MLRGHRRRAVGGRDPRGGRVSVASIRRRAAAGAGRQRGGTALKPSRGPPGLGPVQARGMDRRRLSLRSGSAPGRMVGGFHPSVVAGALSAHFRSGPAVEGAYGGRAGRPRGCDLSGAGIGILCSGNELAHGARPACTLPPPGRCRSGHPPPDPHQPLGRDRAPEPGLLPAQRLRRPRPGHGHPAI